MVNQHQSVAKLFHLVHLVGAHNNGFSGVALFDQQIFDQLGVDGIKRGKRLINDDNLRVMDQGGDELTFLLHPLAELFGFLLAWICKIKLSQVFWQAFRNLLLSQSFERGR